MSVELAYDENDLYCPGTAVCLLLPLRCHRVDMVVLGLDGQMEATIDIYDLFFKTLCIGRITFLGQRRLPIMRTNAIAMLSTTCAPCRSTQTYHRTLHHPHLVGVEGTSS